MILSALLTSVGINLGLCFLFFTLYSILRKQPGNVTVYGPRLIQDGESQQTNAFNLERLLPTAGWVRRALEPTNEEILSNLGLDALVFIRVLVFRWFYFFILFGWMIWKLYRFFLVAVYECLALLLWLGSSSFFQWIIWVPSLKSFSTCQRSLLIPSASLMLTTDQISKNSKLPKHSPTFNYP